VNGTPALKVAVIHPTFLTREGIVRVVESEPGFAVVATAGDLDEARTAITRTLPDVVVTGLFVSPTGSSGAVQLAVELHETHPKIGFVVLSQSAQVADAQALLEGGAMRRAYLLNKRITDPSLLTDAIESVARGVPVIDPEALNLLLGTGEPRTAGLQALTHDERVVLGRIAEGASNEAIANDLVLTTRAVERRTNSIFRKLKLPAEQEFNRRVLAAVMYSRAVDAESEDRASST
jgi:DNA-binding NarL/FixJ family response regulator